MFEIQLVFYSKLAGKNLVGHQQGETLLPMRKGPSISACWLRQFAKKAQSNVLLQVTDGDRAEAGAANLVGAQYHRNIEWFGLSGTLKNIQF